VLFFAVGELLQDKAVERSRTSIRALMDIRPDYASLVRDGEYVRVSPEEIVPGQLIIVRPGERVPLDGVIIEGVTTKWIHRLLRASRCRGPLATAIGRSLG